MVKEKNNCVYKLSREFQNGFEISDEVLEKQASKFFKEYYLNEEYENYFVEYSGNIVEAFEKINYGAVFAERTMFAAVALKKGMLSTLIKDVPEIINIERSSPYSLSSIIPSTATEAFNLDSRNDLGLNGQGVIVGIVSTGIDYLNEKFMTQDRRTRVVGIWDQTLSIGAPPKPFHYGTEFNETDINNALLKSFSGGNPYDIVPHKDEVGHGTAIAGIIGARRTGEEDKLIGIASRCQFAIVKVKKAKKLTLEEYGVDEATPNVYESTDLASAISYLAALQDTLRKPMVVYLALGSTFGGHAGRAGLERYIDFFGLKRGFAIVTDTGDEGDGSTHASGEVFSTGAIKTIEINVDKEEKNFYTAIWFRNPDVFSIGITAPTGEKIRRVSIPMVNGSEVSFTLNSSTVTISYFIQAQVVADKMIGLLIKNAEGGVWKIDLIGDYVVYGRYDIWLLQRALLKKETRVLAPDPYTTLTIPSTAVSSITTSQYNQLTNSLIFQAGKGFTRDGRVKPSVLTGAINILSVGLDRNLIVISGAAVAGAILTGLSALLFQWGFVQRNDVNMFAQKLNSYIIRGTVKISVIIYPNPEWGFGLLSFKEVFNNLKSQDNEEVVIGLCDLLNKELCGDRLHCNIPKEICERLLWNLRGHGDGV